MASSDLFDQAQKYLMNTYARQPVLFYKGRGTRLYDPEGREYLDFVSGVAVNNLGHCHPNVTVAFQKQAQRLVHVSNLYHNEPQIRLAKLLVENSFADKAFFCNSGAEANEAAIKLVRKYAHETLGTDRFEIVCFERSFHGRTLATITATGQSKYQEGFGPLVPGFRHAAFNDIKSVEAMINDKTAALMIEPIQAEGGIHPVESDFLRGIRKLCDDRNLLLVFDEVQTGIGRTGRLFAYEHWGIEPDIMTLAKGLGSGLPIGALLARDAVARAFKPGSHASTFGGNPLACSAGIATLEVVLENGFTLDNCRRMGTYLQDRLNELKGRHSVIKNIRGMGLLIGMELSIDGKPIVEDCLNAGILINCVMGRVLRFIPPLIVMKEEIDSLVDRLDVILKERASA
jgi:acetylornithine/N-succinyldiaminopimelate aminotransferase